MGGAPLDTQLLESLFLFNDLAYVIVSALPEWGMRHGWDLALENGDAAEAQKVESKVRYAMDGLGAHRHQSMSAVWGQLYGGGLLLVGAVDGRSTEEPLDIDNLERIDWIRDVARADVMIEQDKRYKDPRSPKYGEPMLYRILERGLPVPMQPVLVHESRVIRYPGAITPRSIQAQNQGWDLSVMDRVYAKLALHA